MTKKFYSILKRGAQQGKFQHLYRRDWCPNNKTLIDGLGKLNSRLYGKKLTVNHGKDIWYDLRVVPCNGINPDTNKIYYYQVITGKHVHHQDLFKEFESIKGQFTELSVDDLTL